MSEAAAAAAESLNESNPNPNYGFQCNTGFNQSPWIPPPREPFYPIPTFMGFEGDPYCNGPSFAPHLSQTVNGKMEYQTMDSAVEYVQSTKFVIMAPQMLIQLTICSVNILTKFSMRMVRLGSSARKKRMARQN
ncbi:hypothetical protein KY285_036394 [Solanum tuberosum]|nr:hypothetical protein KY285_036394 [Solanum tuberosum]